jgi:hypothetical protein
MIQLHGMLHIKTTVNFKNQILLIEYLILIVIFQTEQDAYRSIAVLFTDYDFDF